MKIAIVGTGIAGNVAAFRLARDHDITVFEAQDRIGGHSNTVELSVGGEDFAIDTGFIVYNERTYPNFTALLRELGVPSQASEMSFSVRCERSGLEYNGASLNRLFSQRRNLLRPSFYRMLGDILRFNREAPALLAELGEAVTIAELLRQQAYGREFAEHYLLPMGAAIWSARPDRAGDMPARFFLRFCHNHGLLSLRDRPAWRVIQGGSRCYVDKLVAGHRDRIRLGTPVEWVRRHTEHVEVKVPGAEPERFDRLFVACHSDQALALLADASEQEREVLGAIRYQRNEAVLHSDATLMPRRRRAWAAWNYLLPRQPAEAAGRVVLSYNMNILQSLRAPVPLCVTLNHRAAIDPTRIIRVIQYAHPIFTQQALAAQRQQRRINGTRRTYYCGAYWRNGFHEDGVVSALNALRHLADDLRAACGRRWRAA